MLYKKLFITAFADFYECYIIYRLLKIDARFCFV